MHRQLCALHGLSATRLLMVFSACTRHCQVASKMDSRLATPIERHLSFCAVIQELALTGLGS